MKRLLSILIIFSMVFSSFAFAFAEDVDTETELILEDVVTEEIQEETIEEDLDAWKALIGEYTETPVNAYTPAPQVNLLLQDESITPLQTVVDDAEVENDTESLAEYVDGEILFSRSDDEGLISSIKTDKQLKDAGISEIEEVIAFDDNKTTWYKGKTNSSVEEAVEALADIKGIKEAEPNFVHTTEVYTEPSDSEKSSNWSFYKAHDKSPDSGLHLGWWKDRVAVPGEEVAADINPGAGVVVAVIDTGVDYTHDDLAANMWINQAEANGIPGVDDDGNGYIDDIYGANVLATGLKSGDPMDDNGHGTHVAGIIAMSANDAGSVGIAWGSKIMAIKAGQATGSFTSENIAKAIDYAHQMGADVINMSFGGKEKSYLVEQALASAFTDCVLVAAAGNNGKPTKDTGIPEPMAEDTYPAGYSYVIGVMASDKNGELAYFSNWDVKPNCGAEYEIVAPGVDIYSTIPNNKYASWSGTSMAAPQVAAAAAILRSHYANKQIYSSRFIYGQLIGATESTVNYGSIEYAMLNVQDSCTKLPKPEIYFTEVFTLDKPGLSEDNDGDYIIDAGETIDIGFAIKNIWGSTKDIEITADAVSGVVGNPHIQWITDHITLSPIGTLADTDNGFAYDDGLLVNVDNPLRFKVLSGTDNNTEIQINLTAKTKNGADINDEAEYYAHITFTLTIVNGMSIKGEIKTDRVLDNKHYWIIENSLFIDKDATLTVEPGTQIQFWSSDYEDVYGGKTLACINNEGTLLMEGTENAPIRCFTGDKFSSFTVNIFGSGEESLKYCEITNPRLGVANQSSPMTCDHVDHCRLTQNTERQYIRWLNGSSVLESDISVTISGAESMIIQEMTNSVLAGYRKYGSGRRYINVRKSFNNMFVDSSIDFAYGEAKNSLYMNGNVDCYLYSSGSLSTELYPMGLIPKTYNGDDSFEIEEYNGKHYVFMHQTPLYVLADGQYYSWLDDRQSMMFEYDLADTIAKKLNGTLLCIDDKDEEDFIWGQLLSRNPAKEGYTFSTIYADLGITYNSSTGQTWTDGSDYVLDKYVIHNFNPDNPKSPIPEGSHAYIYASIANGQISSKYINAGWVNHQNLFDNNQNPTTAFFIYEVPNTVDEAVVQDAINSIDYDQWSFDYYYPTFTNNAIINPLLSADTSRWTTVTAESRTDRKYSQGINYSGNYWGTNANATINKMIFDADDYAGTLLDIFEDPILTLESESLKDIYPFTTSVWVENSDGNVVSSVSPGESYEVHVTYNRDMDVTVNPTVTYGPAKPFTDYAIEGEWISKTEWVGNMVVSPVMTSGTQYFKTSGGRADTDHWLVCGNDVLRFKFEVAYTGVLAMLLQADGGANKVELSWAQNDYDTLAGYNIYRSESLAGTFSKINSTIVTETEFTDTNVESGKTYYYYFKVVNTDGVEESTVSNTASATPIDNIKPTLSHSVVTSAKAKSPVAISATASDNVGVTSVRLYYKNAVGDDYSVVDLILGTNGKWVGTIPASAAVAPGIYYYIVASDADGNEAFKGTAMVPNHITIDDKPYISGLVPSKVSTTGGNTVTIVGGNFTNNLVLKVGETVISSYSVLDDGQISFITPAKSIGAYAITLTTTDGCIATSTKTLAYTDATSFAQIPTDIDMTSGEDYIIPLYVSLNGELTAFHAELDMSTSDFSSVTVEKCDPNAEYSLTSNYSNGVLYIGCSGAENFNPGSSSPFLNIKVSVKPVMNEKTSDITLHDIKFNGAVIEDVISGVTTIYPNFSLKAVIKFFKDSVNLSGVTVTAGSGSGTTGDDGTVDISGINTSQVIAIASKNDYVPSETMVIGAMDAVKVLQYCVKSSSLSDTEKLAADVDGDGDIDEVDATYILKYAVGNISTFPAGAWKFTPNNKSLTLSSSTTVNFIAVLVGDVDGSWATYSKGQAQ